MKKKIFSFIVPLFLGLTIGFFCLYGLIEKPILADTSASIGSVIDSGTVQATFTVNSQVSGKLYNYGAEIVYINWANGTVEANTNAGDNKGYLPAVSGGIISYVNIPTKVKKFSHATGANTSKLIFVSE